MTISLTNIDLEKTPMARCARRSPFRSWFAWVYFGVFVLSFGLFYIFWCTDSVHDFMLTQLTLRNGTDSIDMWANPRIKMMFNIHVFNYTNMDDFLAYRADKLHVEDIGPYSYLETKKRINVIGEDDTLSFQEEKSFEWVGGRSEYESIVVPNVLMMSASSYVRELPFVTQLSIAALLTSFKQRPFVRVNSAGLFWGYDDAMFNMIKPLLRLKQDVPFEKFGIFAMKTGIDKDLITINTGTQDLRKLGVIEKVNGLDSCSTWNDARCNKIEGTDGTIFPPYLVDNNNDPVQVYSKEMCRSLNLEFAEHTTQYNVPVLRYKPSPNTFTYSDNLENECYCQIEGESKVCPRNGLLDISRCINISPILMSSPHFLGGDKSLLQEIDGLHPRPEIHESYLDIYPGLAAPIAAYSRLQVNVEVQKAAGLPQLGRLKDGMILPIVWMELMLNESNISDEVLGVIYIIHVTVPVVVAILQWSSLAGMILSLLALLVCFKKHRMEHPDVGLQMNSTNSKPLQVS